MTKHVRPDRLKHLVAIVQMALNSRTVNVKLFNVSPVGLIALNHVVEERLFAKFFMTGNLSLKDEDVTSNRVQSKSKANQSVLHVTMVTGFANRHRVRMENLAK